MAPEKKGKLGASLSELPAWTETGGVALTKGSGSMAPALRVPTDWILKVIQAAVRGRAEKIRIRQTSSTTTIGVAGPPPIESYELESAFYESRGEGRWARDYLLTALRYLSFVEGRDWALRSPAWSESYHFHQGELERRQVTQKEGEGWTLEVEFPPRDRGRRLGGILRGAGRARDEYLAVVRGALLCPLPLTFDGRRLDRFEPAVRTADEGSLAYLSLGIGPASDSEEEEGGGAALALPIDLEVGSWRPTDKFSDGRPFTVAGNACTRQSTALWHLHFHYKLDSKLFPGPGRGRWPTDTHSWWRRVAAESFLHWVLDGVVIDSVKLFSIPGTPIGLNLYLPAEGLPLNPLAGPIKNDLSEERREKGIRQARQSLQEVADALQSHLPLPWLSHALYFGGMGVVIAGVALTSPMPFFAPLGLAVSPPLIFSSMFKKAIVKDCIVALKRTPPF